MDYPLNEERGIPLKVVMEGYRSAQKKAKKLYGVEIVYIAGLDRTLSSERCLSFVKALRPYLDMVAGLGMLVGNLAGGHLSDRFSPERVARFIQGMICLLLVGIFFAARIDWLVIPLMFLTTASLFGVSSPQQLLILENAPGGEMLGAASIQIAFNLGNALGAYFGGLPISFGLGPQYAALPGAAMALLGFVMFSVYCSLYGRNKTHRILSENEMRG